MRHVKIPLPAIYPITDTSISGLSIPEQVQYFIAGGAKLIQIREKNASSRAFLKAVEASIAIARTYDVRVIVNDRVDIAMLSKADGVHLGQEDLSPNHARQLLGPEAIIGYSTHTIDQVRSAAELPIDYLAFGPVFPTSTKSDPDPVVGLKILRQVKKIAGDLPLVAIGGITAENLRSVLDAGADTAAIISGVLSKPRNIAENVADLITICLPK
ncbi:MAG: thiamine phosphate synthase [Acidobacteria bacterium]|nr:thiamine phosphate synthase [Acidobacteriota bacterium]